MTNIKSVISSKKKRSPVYPDRQESKQEGKSRKKKDISDKNSQEESVKVSNPAKE